jgi:hypothetical protein
VASLCFIPRLAAPTSLLGNKLSRNRNVLWFKAAARRCRTICGSRLFCTSPPYLTVGRETYDNSDLYDQRLRPSALSSFRSYGMVGYSQGIGLGKRTARATRGGLARTKATEKSKFYRLTIPSSYTYLTAPSCGLRCLHSMLLNVNIGQEFESVGVGDSVSDSSTNPTHPAADIGRERDQSDDALVLGIVNTSPTY